MTRNAASLLGLAALAAALAPLPAAAQTVITGHHDKNNGALPDGNGFDATGGAYVVGPDSAGVPNATFDNDNNGGSGIHAVGSSASPVTLSIAGGQFDSDGYGLRAGLFSSETVSGGVFTNNSFGLETEGASAVAISGGTFNGNGYDLYASHGTAVTVTGGDFESNTTNFYVDDGTRVNLYGQFDGLTPGRTENLSYNYGGISFFTGQLEFATAPQTFFYATRGNGLLILNDVAPTPEPSQAVGLGLGALGLTGLALKARRRQIA